MQIHPSIIGLQEFDSPVISSKLWYDLNRSKDVYFINDSGNVSINFAKTETLHKFETYNGILTGTSRGEWGGELTFKNNSIEYTILNENVCGILNYKNEIYVLTGLTHLSISEGKIIKIEAINDKWEPTFSIEINNSPRTYTIFKNKLYMVTFDGLIVFDGNSIQQLLSNQFWSSLYPQSIFINDKIMAIGMRGCLAIVNKETYGVKCFRK